MAVSVANSGTQTATINTEHTLATITTAGTYIYVVSMVNLAAAEVVELRIYTKIAGSGETEQLAYYFPVRGTVSEMQIYSIPVPSPISFKATLKQTSGTGRSFVWAVYAL